ncbi:reversion-inducing cysteine-rich protein with Kazal motifs-like [Ptychodera flava]|uniref:reversion-inducing cysteine-rich protein with Kazal motifs-like n=1 Tax=Ptychodera flava TaxID=63121 RepID=UPI003969F190
MIIRLVISVLLVAGVHSQDPHCCHNVNSHPECQNVCDQMALESTQAGRQRHVASLRSDCPMTLVSFWQCVNATAPDIWFEDTSWYGQRCCGEARNDDCRIACQRAHATSDLSESCSRNGLEDRMFNCLDRFETQRQCCGQAPMGTLCRSKCQFIFEMDYPSSEDQITIENYCQEIERTEVSQCVEDYTSSLPVREPKENLYCCDRAENDRCRETCQHVLQTLQEDTEIINALIADCGDPLPQYPLWQCFILNSGNRPVNNGVLYNQYLNGAQLHCCAKAATMTCRDLCIKLSTTKSSRESWLEFNAKCGYQLKEVELTKCIDDVEKPCQLGCSGLDYCSHFNGRPTEYFRSCSIPSDTGAEADMTLWEAGMINLPTEKIPVLDIRECEPDMWKSIACFLQIKPCHSKSHTNLICKSDCMTILTKCLDKTRTAPYQTPENLCSQLSPSDDSAPCLSLQSFPVQSSHSARMHEVNVPCHSNPCSNDTARVYQLCKINRQTCDYNDVCYDYSCEQGCKLGEGSKFLVPHGSYVRIPDMDSNEPGCYKVCRCGTSNLLEDCYQDLCIDSSLKCKESGQTKDHHTYFHVDCNICSCYAGELSCSLRQCLSDENTPEEKRRYTGLPCDSTDEFVPVCGMNGRTYPNAHIAICNGLEHDQFEIGSCTSKNPCEPNPCPSFEVCIPHRKVCLSTTECNQYICVSSSMSCAGQLHEPVCDTEEREHANLCTMLRRGKKLAYYGRCQRACHEELSVTVCGQNGETYISKCAAWSDRVTIDYLGHCQAVGKLSDEEVSARCSTVKCPKWNNPSCVGITPPGACCPICAGQLRILYSTKVTNDVAEILEGPVTVFEIISQLRRHISVAECDLYGYLSIEGDIVVLVVPIVQNPTDLQVDACNKETLKLESIINSGSPVESSFVQLSGLTAAFAKTSVVNIVSSSTCLQISKSVLILQFFLLQWFYFLFWKR